MKKGLLFLLLATGLFTGCSNKNDVVENKKDFKSTNEVLENLNNLNNTGNKLQETKVNTYIIKNPEKSTALRSQPKIMETLFLGYIDEKDNRISDYFVNTVIDSGEWIGKNGKSDSNKKLGGLNE